MTIQYTVYSIQYNHWATASTTLYTLHSVSAASIPTVTLNTNNNTSRGHIIVIVIVIVKVIVIVSGRQACPGLSFFTRGLVKYVPGRGLFRAVASNLGDKFRTSPPPSSHLLNDSHVIASITLPAGGCCASPSFFLFRPPRSCPLSCLPSLSSH